MDTHAEPNMRLLMERLDVLTGQVSYLVERQRKQEELFAELSPILKEVMATATERLDALEKDGTFAFLRELSHVGERVLQSYTADDARQFGDAIVGILDTIRAVTQPHVLQVLGEASVTLSQADTTEPLGLVGMVRATRNDDVQRGMAVLMELLKKVGHGARAVADRKAAPLPRLAANAGGTAPARKILGVERGKKPDVAVRGEAPAGACATPRKPAATAAVIDGIAFGADGHLVDPAVWTKALAETLAATHGVTLTDAHWKVIDFARGDFEKTKASPNIRRITQSIDVTTREMYALFPKAPGRTVAKIAGIPKPAGCL